MSHLNGQTGKMGFEARKSVNLTIFPGSPMIKFNGTWRDEMGRFREYSYEQTVLLPINFKKQILPGTFEYTLHNLIDEKLDLSLFYMQSPYC